MNMDRYCGFVYHSLIEDLISQAVDRLNMLSRRAGCSSNPGTNDVRTQKEGCTHGASENTTQQDRRR